MTEDKPAKPTAHLPKAPGVYMFRDASGRVLYIGKAGNLAKRVAQYFDPNRIDSRIRELVPLSRSIDYLLCKSERDALLLEDKLVKRYKPFFNTQLRDDKTYPWIKLTINEDYPRVLWTRRKLKDGALYFGPYPKVSLVRGLLKYLFRTRIIPLRPCRWEFDLKKPLSQKKIQSCLYYHTRQCPAPCAGRIPVEDYRKLADEAALFLQGQFMKLEKEFDKQMQSASKELDFEKAGEFRDRLSALRHMRERVRFHAVGDEDLAVRLEGSRGVTALQNALGLKNPPLHIEAVDISHAQGKQTTGSFVCFLGGEPNKDHYRRFRVKTVPGIDDYASMREVVGRRIIGLQKAGSPLPDLLLIDGGKGQLAAALEAIREQELKIPAAGLAKREEEIFLPDRSDPILLDRADPGLRLLQHLRDEAHRFAKKYHSLLHSKEMLGQPPYEKTDDTPPAQP